MSALDQAFIKAYGKEARATAHQQPFPPPHVTPQKVDPPRREVAWPDPAAEKIPLSSWQPPAASVPAAHVAFAHQSVAAPVAPSPIISPQVILPHVTAPQVTPTPIAQPSVAPPQVEQPAAVRPAGVVGPTLVIGPRPNVTTPALVELPAVGLHAAFEVPRWNWPPIVSHVTLAASTGFSSLATLIEQRAREGRKVVVVTGAKHGEGRTTVAFVLARLMGARKTRVALVDADFERPQIADRLQLQVHTGWEDILAGDQPLEEGLVESVGDQVTVLPLRAPMPELLRSAQLPMAQSIEQLRKAFDVVLLDTGPLVDDAAAVDFAATFYGARIDDALIVRDVKHSNSEQVRQVGHRLSAAGIAHWDIVENFSGE